MRTLALALLPCALCAQEFRGSISGRVTDPSGAAVPRAVVEARNAATNFTARAASNEAGVYQIPFLDPADYTVHVQASGFKSIERTGIRVAIAEPLTLDFALEIGAASESVTVSADTSLLSTVNADLGQVLDNRYTSMIAISLSRNVINLRNLAPGVTGDTGTYTSSAQANFSIAGGGSGQGKNEIIVDGIPNTTAGGTIGFVPSVDSVQEVRVHTTMFDAAYGHSNGGALSIVTRGGTNEPHGAFYVYKRWKALTANSWTNNRLGLDQPPVEYHQWGYTVGGPVWIPKLYNGRNRTFFSTSLERDHDPRELTRQARVPTQAERGGDFSQTLNRTGGAFAIYDPSTNPRQPFAGARIPTARISPIGTAVLSKYPLPNQPGANLLAAFNWAASATYTVDNRQWSARIDHELSQRQRLFGRVSVLDRYQLAQDLFQGATSYPVLGGTDLGSLVRRRVNVGIDDTIVVSPSLVGSIRVSGLSYTSNTLLGGVGLNPKDLQIPDVIASNQALHGWPSFDPGENIPAIGSTQSFSRETVYSALSTWTKLTGRHSTKFGVDYRQNRNNSVSPGGNAPGSFSVGPTFTQSDPLNRNAANTSGSGMASLLLGLADSGNFGYNTPTSVRSSYWGLFVQDDWKVNSRLTLNLGLRYELETPWVERYNRASYRFDPDAPLPVKVPGLDLRGGVLFAGINGNPRAVSPDKNNFGPRFGFAYSPLAKTVVRGGYGIFYSTIALNTSFFGALNVYNALTPFVGSNDGGVTPATTLANPFPAGLVQPIGSSIGLMAQVGDTLSIFNDRRVNPYNQQWQFSIQQELPSRVLFEAAYMGMHSLKQIESFNLNEKPDVYLALGRAENNTIPNPFLNLFPATSTLGRGATITQNRLWGRYPQFTTLTLQGANTGNSMYHSLQMKVDKRLSHGFNVLGTYTLARIMDNNTTSIVNQRHYRAVSAFDQRHVLRIASTYQLPLRFQGWKRALGGWSTGGYYTFNTGVPLSVTQANGRPIRIKNPKLDGPVSSRLGDRRDARGNVLNPYFDITAFQALPDQYTISPEPPALDELRAPRSRSLNLAVFKTFPIHERLRLEFRMEATGVTNTPNFDPPGTNMSQTATFGIITSAGGNRATQASLRLAF